MVHTHINIKDGRQQIVTLTMEIVIFLVVDVVVVACNKAPQFYSFVHTQRYRQRYTLTKHDTENEVCISNITAFFTVLLFGEITNS